MAHTGPGQICCDDPGQHAHETEKEACRERLAQEESAEKRCGDWIERGEHRRSGRRRALKRPYPKRKPQGSGEGAQEGDGQPPPPGQIRSRERSHARADAAEEDGAGDHR
jgi:hypothetical protein